MEWEKMAGVDIYGICPACKAVVAFPNNGQVYNCIACQAQPPLLRTADLFKAGGAIIEGPPKAKVMELMLILQEAIRKEMVNKDAE